MTDITREEIARIIAKHFAANFDVMFKDKQDYLRHSGQHKSGHRWGVNGPFQDDCLYAADDVLQALDARGGWRPIMWRYKDALEIIAGDGCESFASGYSCIKSPERHRQSLYGAHTWCVACIARHALEGEHQPVQEKSDG